jgi:hypothetical protein
MLTILAGCCLSRRDDLGSFQRAGRSTTIAAPGLSSMIILLRVLPPHRMHHWPTSHLKAILIEGPRRHHSFCSRDPPLNCDNPAERGFIENMNPLQAANNVAWPVTTQQQASSLPCIALAPLRRKHLRFAHSTPVRSLLCSCLKRGRLPSSVKRKS